MSRPREAAPSGSPGQFSNASSAGRSGLARAWRHFFLPLLYRPNLRMIPMRFLWTYLLLGVVFTFGFVCAPMFTVGMTPPRRARRGAEPKAKPYMSNFYQE